MDPQARAGLRLKLLVKGEPSFTNERSQLWAACLKGMSTSVPGLPCTHACLCVAGAALPQKGRHLAALPQKGKTGTTKLQSSRTFLRMPQKLPLPVMSPVSNVCVWYRDNFLTSNCFSLLVQEPAHVLTAA